MCTCSCSSFDIVMRRGTTAASAIVGMWAGGGAGRCKAGMEQVGVKQVEAKRVCPFRDGLPGSQEERHLSISLSYRDRAEWGMVRWTVGRQ